MSEQWKSRAACRDVGVALFHPSGAGRRNGQKARDMAQYCLTCPVIGNCLADVLRFAPHRRRGVWGGFFWPDSGAPPIDLLWWSGLCEQARPDPGTPRRAKTGGRTAC